MNKTPERRERDGCPVMILIVLERERINRERERRLRHLFSLRYVILTVHGLVHDGLEVMTGVKLLYDCNLKGNGLYGKFVLF